jgi:hypothetical protein
MDNTELETEWSRSTGKYKGKDSSGAPSYPRISMAIFSLATQQIQSPLYRKDLVSREQQDREAMALGGEVQGQMLVTFITWFQVSFWKNCLF